MNAKRFLLLACGCSGFLLCVTGCERSSPQLAPPTAPAVPVSRPVARNVTDYVDFTGRTQAVKSVNVVARVTGFLGQPLFREGSEVKAGSLLFEIDPRPYQAQYDQAVGQVNLYKAQLKLAKVTLARDEQLVKSAAVSAQQIDQDRAAVDEADAQVKAAAASLEIYKLNLNFTKVTSPIDGQVGRYNLTLGNLVNQDQTLLTTVLSLDPMYAYFDVDEPTVLRVRRAINDGRIKVYGSEQIPVLMGLEGEEGFPRKGTIDFTNNQINPGTASILVRGVFDNPLPPGGRRLLLAGMFVRIHLPIGQPHPALLVIDRAIGSDQGLKYVYVVDAENKVQYRRVTTGPLESDGLRVITEGLKPNDVVVVGGLQQVHPHMPIQSEEHDMLTLIGKGADKSAAPAPATRDKAAATPATSAAATALSVLGADGDAGESSLTYTWTATTLPSGATAPAFSANGTNSAKNTTATLSKAGTYGFTVTITDSGGLSVASSVSVPVAQTLTTIAVSPAKSTVTPPATQQFTATGNDQFGSALATQPSFTWTTTVGTITEGGLFTPQNSPGRGTVTAGAPGGYPLVGAGRGTIHGTSSVTVTSHGPTVAKPASATPKPP